MYNVSSQFHTAVMSGSPPERIKLTFTDNTVLDNDYVVGLDLDESVCEDSDLTVGSVLGSQLTVHIYKDEAEFQGFDFDQDFTAELGVRLPIERCAIMPEPSADLLGKIVQAAGDGAKTYGKNLCPKPMAKTKNGITLTVSDDGTCTLNGTASGQAHFSPSMLDHNYAGQMVKFSANNPVGIGNSFATSVQIAFNSTQSGNAALTQAERTVTVNAPVIDRVQIIVSGGVQLNNFVIKLQLELGSTATPYAPYHEYTTGHFYRCVADGDSYAWDDISDDETYEYCPLGTFRAEKPETVRVTSLTLTAYDKMRLFDVPLDGFVDAITLPKTAKQLFTAPLYLRRRNRVHSRFYQL